MTTQNATQWARAIAPWALAVMASGAMALIVVREQVRDMRAVVNRGILPITEERLRSMTIELQTLRHQNEELIVRMAQIEQNGPTYCLKCHMLNGLTHPPVRPPSDHR